jgi:adenine/guanine phosphoribosyltransferase-like PRPP-binding protein
MQNHQHGLIDEIARSGSCEVIDDARWNTALQQFEGSLLWHGVPTTLRAMSIFADFVRSTARTPEPDVVVAVSSSGISWGTAIAVQIGRPVAVLRVEPHKYGPINAEVRRYAGRRAWLVDNHCGSGETVDAARSLLARYGVTLEEVFVVEAQQRLGGIQAAVLVTDKLQALLALGCFGTVEREVVGRFLCEGRQYLNDAEWVRGVQMHLAQRPDDCLRKGGV